MAEVRFVSDARCESHDEHGTRCLRAAGHYPDFHHGVVACVDGFNRRRFWPETRMWTQAELEPHLVTAAADIYFFRRLRRANDA